MVSAATRDLRSTCPNGRGLSGLDGHGPGPSGDDLYLEEVEEWVWARFKWRAGNLQPAPIPYPRPMIFPKLEGVGVGDVYDVAKREALRPEELSKINKRGR